jgi:hypothetical protein
MILFLHVRNYGILRKYTWIGGVRFSCVVVESKEIKVRDSFHSFPFSNPNELPL